MRRGFFVLNKKKSIISPHAICCGLEDFLYWAIEFSAKEKGKSHDEEVKYFAECFDAFVLGQGKELFFVDEAGMEYLIAREQYKNARINLIDWIVDSSRDDKISLSKFMNWLMPSPPNTQLPPRQTLNLQLPTL